MVMSDNICFPAKLVHSHVQDLIEKKVDRIFMPFVIFERKGMEQNSYNCPIDIQTFPVTALSIRENFLAPVSRIITFAAFELVTNDQTTIIATLAI